MPDANVRGINIHYELIGSTGPVVALSPGGRRALDAIQAIAEGVAAAGYRVLLHDRRNCGLSDVVIDGDESEYAIWADDLYDLLGQLDAAPAFVGGASSGCRMSLLFALRHSDALRGLILWRVTGGHFAANRLAENYYGQFITAAQAGGMTAVCETEHFKERIEADPANRERLMSLTPERFIAVMSNWRRYFLEGADLPVIGVTADELASISVPALVVPGNDNTHPRQVGENAASLMPNSELRVLLPEHIDVDVASEAWDEKEPELVGLFTSFLDRVSVPAPARP